MQEIYIEKNEVEQMRRLGLECFHQQFRKVGDRVRPHIHNAIEILWIRDGHFQVIADSGEYSLGVGELILLRSNTIHRMVPCEENSSYDVLKISPAFILSMASRECGVAYLLNLSVFHERSKIVWSAEDVRARGIDVAFEQLFLEADGSAYCADLSMKAWTTIILSGLLRDIGTKTTDVSPIEKSTQQLNEKIYEAIVFVNEHYVEDISAQSCSKHLYMSYSYFAKRFKYITGKTFRNYLMTTRANHAEKDLLGSDKPITQIAMECGFCSHAYFSAVYKKIKGVTPSETRESARKKRS